MKQEFEYQSNGQPIALSFEELKEKLGYRSNYRPRLGNLGKALFSAIKSKRGHQRSINWLRKQLDELYGTKRKAKRREKGRYDKYKN